MKVIEVKEQVRLPLMRCAELVLSGLKYRLFRASITVIIIALAGAFLMVMLTEGLIARRVADDINVRIAPRETLRFWVARISLPLTHLGLAEELATAQSGGPRWREYATWGHLDDNAIANLSQLAKAHQKYLEYFKSLTEGQRRVLIGRTSDEAIFSYLADPAKFEILQEGMKTSARQLPASMDQFRQFIKDWNATSQERQQILAGDAAAVAEVKKTILAGGKTPQDVFVRADPALLDKLRSLGFSISNNDLPVLKQQAALSIDAKRLVSLYMGPAVSEAAAAQAAQAANEQLEESPDQQGAEGEAGGGQEAEAAAAKQRSVVLVKNLLATRRDVNVTKVNDQMLYDELVSRGGAEWFVEVTGCDKRLGLDAKRVEQVASAVLDQTKLETIKNSVSQVASEKGFLGFNTRAISLILVSFVVCIVGITNAMLMSVTERFREIATMKCLGATDGFIMINFILESIMQGVAGGAVGVVLGLVLGMLRAWGSYGLMALTAMPALAVLAAASVALAVSIIISALAAVYPAWVAARLAPMEAMRIE